MRCYNCGNEIPEQSVFCGICGARIEPDSNPVESAMEPEPITEPEQAPVEPVTEPEQSPVEPVTIPITEPEQGPVEPVTIPVTEPEQSPVEPVTVPVTEPEQSPIEPIAEPEPNPVEPEAETEQTEGVYSNQYGESEQTEEFVIKHCPYCGAVLMSGAKFCSNCGNSIVVYEQNMRSRYRRKVSVKIIIAAVAAAIVIIFGAGVLLSSHSIEGEWVVEHSGGGFFDMFSESYLDFDDDGTAVYYNGLFTARRYDYTYNRFTKILTLRSVGRGSDMGDSRLHVDWIDRYTIFIPELNMRLCRIDNIPYAYEDDEFDDDDVVVY